MVIRRIARATVRRLTWLSLRITPARRLAVVHGLPDSEANAHEVLRALVRRYPHEVVWLLNDEDYLPPRAVERDLGRVRRIRKNSAAGYWAAVTAEVTFFTHGLFTSVQPPADRLVVNVWHGDGPKGLPDARPFRSTVASAGTRLWGSARDARFSLPPGSTAIVGNPRVDEFLEPPNDAELGELGLDPQRPFVLWLPTYRSSTEPLVERDSRDLSDNASFASIVEACAAATALGVDVVVKPHYLDPVDFAALGLRVVTQDDLDRARVSLYSLLGAASAVVSDVSSVWTDFLALDRPVAFYIPDLEELQARRGFNVDDLEALLPGPRIVDGAALTAFVSGVASGDMALRPSRWPGWAVIGPQPAGGATDRLLDWLDAYQVAHDRAPLFAQTVQPDAEASSQG